MTTSSRSFFLWVRDLDASFRFYVEDLGFSMKHEWVDDGKRRWCWLVLGGAAIMLQEFFRDGHDTNLPETPTGLGVAIYFICKDAIALYRSFKVRGVTVERPIVSNGMWMTQVADPDGYRLYFESPTDASEETTFADG